MKNDAFSIPPMTFSESVSGQLEKSLHLINKATLINNQRIKAFRARAAAMDPDIQDLATILGTQVSVLEEKYKLLQTLVMDLYERL
ncbi:hypothetical protein EBR96_09535, partial [bacterium]|nr:hypothetical protein [bacterium]